MRRLLRRILAWFGRNGKQQQPAKPLTKGKRIRRDTDRMHAVLKHVNGHLENAEPEEIFEEWTDA